MFKYVILALTCLFVFQGSILASETTTWAEIDNGGSVEELGLVVSDPDPTLPSRYLNQATDDHIQWVFLRTASGTLADILRVEEAIIKVQSLRKIPTLNNAEQGRYLSIPPSYVEGDTRTDDEGNQYTVFIPTQISSFYRNTFLTNDISGIDDYDVRVTRYRQLFLDAVLQPDLRDNPIDPNGLASRTGQILDILDKMQIPIDVAEQIVHVHQYTIDASYVQQILSGAQNLPQGPVHHAFDKLGKSTAWISVFSLGYTFVNGGIQQMLLQCLANADAEARLDALERLIGRQSNLDPALQAGFLEAKSGFETMTNKYYENFAQAAMDGVANDPNVYISAASLAVGITQTIVPALSGLGWAVGPYFLAAGIFFSITEHQESCQLACAAATVHQLIYTDEGIEYLHSEISQSAVINSIYGQDLLHLFSTNYWIGHYFNSRMQEVLNNWVVGWLGLLYPSYDEMVDDLDARATLLAEYYARTRAPYFLAWYADPLILGDEQTEWPWLSMLIKANVSCSHSLNPDPTPVSPASGDRYTNFAFSVVYVSPGLQEPDAISMSVDGGAWEPMSYIEGDISSGATYSKTQTGFAEGDHIVIMKCTVDGCDEIIIGPFSFTVGMPSSPGLTFVASPDNICAFTEESRLTATLLDDYGNPIVGEYISIFPHLGNASTCGLVYDISNQGITDGNGQVTAKFKSTCAGDFAVVADPDNYPARSVLVDVDACSCPYTISIIPTIDIPCGGVVSYRLKPRILDSNGDCLESGKVIWDILNCSGAWFEFGGVNYGSHYELVADGIICDDLSTGWPLLKYSGPGSCDATIRVCIEGFSGCCSSFPIHLDPQCPPVAQPIWQTGPFSIDSEWGKTIQFSPDGKYFISFDTKLYETKNYTIKCSYAGNNRSISHAFSSNGEIVASIVPDYILLNNTNSCEQISAWTCEPLDDPNVVVWSDNRNRMAISGWDEAVVKIIEPPCNTITSLSTGWAVYDLSWKGNKLAAVGDNRGIKVWNATTDSYSLIYTYPQTGCAVEFYSCDFSNDGNKLAVIGESRSCGTFNLYVFTFSGNSISRIDSASYCYNNDVTGVSWSPDGNMLLITGYNNCAKIINTTSASLPVVSELNISNNWSSCDWSPNGLIGVIDGSIKIFTPFDNNPPYVTNLSPMDEYSTSDSQVIVSGTISDEYSLDPNSAKMNVNGGEWVNIYDTSWSFGRSVNINEGVNVITFQYADRMGHWGYDTINVIRTSDTLGPIIVSVGVDDFSEIGSPVHITAKVFDQWSGVDTDSVTCILYRETGDLIGSISMAAVDDTTYECNWESGEECEGRIRITIRAVDKKGNIAIRASVAHFGLYDYPEILAVNIDPLIPDDTTSPLISLGWMDCSNLSQAIAYYAYGDTSGVWQQKNMTIVDHSCNVTLPKKNTGWMYFRMLLTDVYAHSTISPIDSYFIVDVSPPQAVQLLEPYDNRHINNPKPTLSWLSISDPGGSGIEYYSVELADNVMFTGSQTSIVSAGNSWQPSSDLAFGQYYWRVWATDKSGNSGDKSEVWSLFIDNRPPLQPDSVYVNEGLISVWTNDSVFVIRYVESDDEFLGRTILSKVNMKQLALNDTSGISVAYYKLNTPPVENGDFMGVTPYNPFELVVHNRDVLYIWLKDGAGNVDYRNWASIDLLFDNAPVVGVHASIARDTLYTGDTLKVTWNSGTDGEGSGKSDIYDVYAKIGISEWQELVVGLNDITELDTIPDFVNEDSVWVFFEVSTRDQVGNYDSTGVAEDSIFILLIPTDVNDDAKPLPEDFYLAQNHPNPFNPTTTIDFSLTKASEVQLEVYNIAGQKVATLVNNRLVAGYHSVTWDSRNTNGEPLASGIYLYRLKADTFVETKKMMLLK